MSNTLTVRRTLNRVVVRSPGPQGAPGSAAGNVFDSIWLKNPDDGLYYELTLFGTGVVKFKIGQTGTADPT